MTENAELVVPYENFVLCFRGYVEALARQAVYHNSQLKYFAARCASDWALREEVISAEAERDAARVALLRKAEGLREAFYILVNSVEEGFAETFAKGETLMRFKQDPDLLQEVFAERAACSRLWDAILERRTSAADHGELIVPGALPLPSAAEIDAIIAHGVKLVALLDARSPAS